MGVLNIFFFTRSRCFGIAIFSVCFLYVSNVFLTFGFSNLNSQIPILSNYILLSKSMIVCFFIFSFLFWIYISRKTLNNSEAERGFLELKWLVLFLLLTLLFYNVYVNSTSVSLARTTNLFGDEDFHFGAINSVYSLIISPIDAFFNISDINTFFGRYPLLHHYISALTGSSEYLFRDGQAYSYFSLVFLVAVTCWLSPLGRLTGLISIFALGFSPLAYSYLSNLYSDVYIPIFTLLGFISLYSFSKTNSWKWFVIGCGFFSLVVFLRQHMLPTFMVGILGLLFFVFKNYGFTKRTIFLMILTLIVCVVPIFIYLITVTMFFHSDAGRVSLSNVFEQDLYLFVLMFFVYIPSAFFIFYRSNAFGWVGVFLLLSVLGQLSLYMLFEPGWMPWSRNYLSFSGQFIFFMLLAFSTEKKLICSLRKYYVALSAMVLFSLSGIYSYKNNDVLFGENENIMPYEEVLNYLTNNMKNEPSAFYFQVPVYGPTAFHRLLDINGKYGALTYRFAFVKGPDIGNPYAFLNSLSCDAKIVVLHWRSGASLPSIIRNTLFFEKYNPSSGLPFEIVYEIASPLSEGRKGLMVVRRISSCE